MMIRDHFRAHARRRTDLRASLQARDGAWQPVNIRDLGLGGACVELLATESGVLTEPEASAPGRSEAPSPAQARGDSAAPFARPTRVFNSVPAGRPSGAPEPPSLDAGQYASRSLSTAPVATTLERESSVTLEVTTPSMWDPLVVRGKVAWMRRSTPGRATRIGIRFEHREGATVFALFQLLSAQVY